MNIKLFIVSSALQMLQLPNCIGGNMEFFLLIIVNISLTSLICATGRCVFSLHWGLCAPVTPVTLSHLVPAIAINISLFQLCIYH